MKNRSLQLVLLVLLATSCAWAGKIIDRIVVVVNGRPLLQSDWDIAVRFQALQHGRGFKPDAESRRAAFDRIVEQELIRQQMQGLYTPEPEAIQQRERDIRALYPEASTDAGWDRVLDSYGFTRQQIEAAIVAELQTLRFVDIRLRPTVRVDPAEIESYYRDKLVPEVRKRGAEPDSLADLSDQIRELLIEEKINRVFLDWIASLRTQSKIEVFADDEGAQPNSAASLR